MANFIVLPRITISTSITSMAETSKRSLQSRKKTLSSFINSSSIPAKPFYWVTMGTTPTSGPSRTTFRFSVLIPKVGTGLSGSD